MKETNPDERWKALILKLKEDARRQGITQEELAGKIGIEQANLSRIFQCKFRPNLEIFLKIAEALNKSVSIDDRVSEKVLWSDFETPRQELGAFIKERRFGWNYPPALLAASAGISEETLYKIEDGNVDFGINTQLAIFRTLGIKPYFSFLDDTEEMKYSVKLETDPERYYGFYLAENLLLFPEQLAIIKLTDPQVFVRFNYGDSYFAGYEDWKNNIAKVQWLDKTDKPETDEEIEIVLTDCWNFLALHERKEDELYGDDDENDVYFDD